MAGLSVTEAANILWHYHCIYDEPQPGDYIIGLGSYDLRVVDRCVDLFQHGLAPKILFTGLKGHWTRDHFDRSEARIFADRAMELGVDSNVIVLEETATNIGENVVRSAAIAGPQASVILVTKPQTQRRCHATVKRQWPDALALVTAPLHDLADQPFESFDETHLICEMVGDLKRILDYPERGFQIEQPVAQEVMHAYEFLKSEGYTAHL